jgi:hypothetical protein
MKVSGTIDFNKSVNWYGLHSGMFCHMETMVKLKIRRLPFNSQSQSWRTILMPFEVLFMMKHLFLVLKPHCHLYKLIPVGNGICIFCKIDVKVFSVGGVKIVRCAIELDECCVVLSKVQFQDIE